MPPLESATRCKKATYSWRRGSESSAFGGGRQGYYGLFHSGFKQIVSLLEQPVSTWFISHFVSHSFFGSSGQFVGGKVGAILCARVGRMTAKRSKAAARMLPDPPPMIPVETQSPKQLCQFRLSGRGHVQPNPLTDDLGHLVLPRQTCSQVIQNLGRGQCAIGAVPDKIRLRLAGF